MSHVLPKPEAINYIIGGHGKATLVGASNRFTYSFGTPKDKQFPIFVSVLSGPCNESDYRYIGFINSAKELVAGKKGKPDALSFKALNWYLHAPIEISKKAEFLHEGVCCRCGRTLTTPESIEAGIGPVCAEKE